MKESDLVKACCLHAMSALPGVFIWKIADRCTGGIPDVEFDWNGATTKIEFKLLKKNETIHDKWEDGRQLTTCVRLEQQTGRCWVVAYQKAHASRPNQTLIYRPTALLDGKIPSCRDWVSKAGIAADVWQAGGVKLPGFDHATVVQLIKQTHV